MTKLKPLDQMTRLQAWLLILPLVLLTGFASALAGGCTTLQSIAIIPAADFTATLAADYTIPDQMTIDIGDTVQFVAVTYMPGMTPGVIPAGTALNQVLLPLWTSSNPSVATVGTSGANEGLAQGLSGGTTTLNIVSGNLTDTFELIVRDPQADVSVSVAAGNSVPAGDPQQLAINVTSNSNATGVIVDVTFSPVVPVVNSSAPIVCNYTPANGTLTCPPQNLGAGQTLTINVDATSQTAGAHNVTATVRANQLDPNTPNNTAVTALSWTTAVLRNLILTPSTATIQSGTSLQLMVTGIYSDGSQVDLTGNTSLNWTESNPLIVVASNTGVVSGMNLGMNPRTETVTVTDPLTGVTQTASITVDPLPQPLPPIAIVYTADGAGNTVSRFELAPNGQLTLQAGEQLGGTGATGVAVDGTGTVLAATFSDNKLAVASLSANGTLTPWLNSPFTTSATPADPEFYFDGFNLFLYLISGGNAIDAYFVDQQGQTLNQVTGAPFPANTTVQDIQVNAARKTLDVVPAPTGLKTFVIPHILDTKGGITAGAPFPFDTTVFSTYSGLNSGTAAITADSSSVQLYLFDQNTAQPLANARDSEVCENCSNFRISPGALCLTADEQPAGLPARKAVFQIDELHGNISRVGSFTNSTQLGFGTLVVTGDPTGTSLHGFVVNTHTSAFDLSVFAFDPQPLGTTPMSAQRDGDASSHTDAPSCLMSNPQPFFASSAGGNAVDVAVKVLFPPPVPQPPVINFTTTVNGNMVSLDASNSAVTNGVITQIYWDCDSDGTYDVFGEATQCSYPTPGMYNITALAINNIGQTTTLTQPVNIASISPADVSVTVTGSNIDLVQSGQFTVRIQNNGPGFAQSTRLGLPLINEAVISLLNKDKFNATCAITTPMLADCDLLDLAPGEVVNVFVTVAPTAIGSAQLTANLAGNFIDPNPGDNTAAHTIAINGPLSLDVNPDSPNIPVGANLQFTVTGVFASAGQVDVTPLATWSTSDPATATISDALGSKGLATGVAAGNVNISAMLGAASDTVFGIVSSAALQMMTNAQTAELVVGDDPGFSVSINNNGNGAASNLQLDVTINNATLTNIFPEQGWTCMQNGNSATCNGSTLAAASGAHFFFGIDTSFLAGGGNVSLDATVTSAAPVFNLQSQATATTYPALQFTPALPKAGGNVPYMGQLVATGGKGPITFGVQFGAFPTGLNLDGNTGAVTGIATAGGSFPITFFAQDSLPNPQVVSGNVTLDVLFILTTSLPNGTVNSPYSQTITVIGQTNDPNTIGIFSISAGALPDGLMIDQFSGLISGTATTPGAHSFTVEYEETAFSMTGGPNIVTTATQSYSVTIVQPAANELSLNVTGPITGPTILPIPIDATIIATSVTFPNQTFTIQASSRVLTQAVQIISGNISCSAPPFTQGNLVTCPFTADPANPIHIIVVGFADHPAAGNNETFTFTISPGGGNAGDDSFVHNYLAVGGPQITVLKQNFTAIVGDPDVQFTALASAGGINYFDITQHLRWATNNGMIATVSDTPPKGLLHPLMPGGVTVQAFEPHNLALGQSFGNVFSVVGLTVTPAILNQAIGNTVQMQANLLLNNGALHTDVTTRAIWNAGSGLFTVQTAGDVTPGFVTMTGTGSTTGMATDPVTGLSRSFTVNGFAAQPVLTYILASKPNGLDSFFVDTSNGDLAFVGTDTLMSMGSLVALDTCENEVFGGFFSPHSVASSRLDNTTGLTVHWSSNPGVVAQPTDVKASKPCQDVGAVLSSDSSVQMFSRSGPDITPTTKTTIPGTFPIKMYFNPNHPFAYLCNGDQLRVLNHDANAGTVTDTNATRDYANRRDFAISRNGDALYIVTWNFQTNMSSFILQQFSNGQLGGAPISVPLPKTAFAVYSDPDHDVAYALHFDGSITTVQLNIAAGSVTIGPNVPLFGIDNIVIIPSLPWLYYVNFITNQICRVNRAAGGIISGTPACFTAQVPVFYQKLVYSPKN